MVPCSSNSDLSFPQTAVNIQFANSSINVQGGGGGLSIPPFSASGGSNSTCSLQTTLNNNTIMNSSIYSNINNKDNLREDPTITSGKIKSLFF